MGGEVNLHTRGVSAGEVPVSGQGGLRSGTPTCSSGAATGVFSSILAAFRWAPHWGSEGRETPTYPRGATAGKPETPIFRFKLLSV